MENKIELIEKYNTEHGTNFKSIYDIYKAEGTRQKAADKLKVSSATIARWVIEDGGELNSPGGPNNQSKLYEKVKSLTFKQIYGMPYSELGKLIGCNTSWAGCLKRRYMREHAEGL